ncbi:MAG: hypothetical protein Fur0037_12080 [Planctomycetota bacterium]
MPTDPESESKDPRADPPALWTARAMVALTVLGIAMGAMVTSTGSGMAFLDWPLSDGQWMPERSLTTLPGFLEHFHRLIFATVGLLMLLLAIRVGARERTRNPLRRLCLLGLGLVVVQGVFGGVGVLLGTPAATSVTHGVLAQLTLATFAWITAEMTPSWSRIQPIGSAAPGTGRRICAVAFGLILAQTTLGAIARHSGDAVALWSHVGNALIVFVVLVIAAAVATGRLGDVTAVRSTGRWMLGLLVAQVLLGFIALLVRTGKHPENVNHLWRASLISAHVFLGALLTLVTALLAIAVRRATVPRREP